MKKKMESVTKRADRLSDLISHDEELRIDSGASSRSVRQWKKDIKSSYATLIADKERLSKTLKNRQEEIKEEFERRQLESKREQQQEASDKRLSFLRERKIMNGKCGRRNSRQSWR